MKVNVSPGPKLVTGDVGDVTRLYPVPEILFVKLYVYVTEESPVQGTPADDEPDPTLNKGVVVEQTSKL